MPKGLLLGLLLAALLIPLWPEFSAAFSHDVGVRGHFRQDGTYVQPHRRTSPDSNPYNNYSTFPNANPSTGQQETRRYDSDPSERRPTTTARPGDRRRPGVGTDASARQGRGLMRTIQGVGAPC
jgi:hypothetical protein